ncbi:tRNA (guanine-N(7)-)-methyltransferase non-catalytic subunit wuho [Chironomus tepperi]|uniref:tRNA (guanine-N(7)-)-methyltransferase non-catalytic subunit wuho n=1 Tax=Chironomus tepperi TaxID=113505 RepID=UPI00391F9B8F
MESYKEFLVFSPDHQTKIAFLSTQNAKNSFTVDIDWSFPVNNEKLKMFLDLTNDEESKQNANKEDTEKSIINIAINETNDLIAFTSNDKSLFLCKIEESSIKTLSRRYFLRTSSCIRFSNCGKSLFLADKTGDVFEYSCDENNFNTPGKWIFGHISQILDLKVSTDSKYILTTDRDEKIRVTNSPNYHEIEMFCLGHKEFVSSLIPLNNELLMSISGDGTLRLWNYLSGKQLDFTKFSFVPILFKNFPQSSSEGILCIATTDFHIKVYEYQLIDNNALKLHLLGEKQYSSDIEIAILKGNFYIENIEDVNGVKKLSIDKIQIENKNATFVALQDIYTNLNLVTDSSLKITKPFDVSLLFKNTGRFDNLKQYTDRKKARIESQAMKKK